MYLKTLGMDEVLETVQSMKFNRSLSQTTSNALRYTGANAGTIDGNGAILMTGGLVAQWND